MTIVANMRLGTCRARFRRGLCASQACLGRILAALGAAFGQFLEALGRLLDTFCVLFEHSWSHLGSHGCLRLDFGRSLVPPGWVLESSSGNFRHGFWLCLSRVATDSP